MGAYTCEFGVVHRVCRCPKTHTIKCDKPDEHHNLEYVPKHRKETPKRSDLTQSERAAYQAMLAHEYDEEDAYESALDGVDVETVRRAGNE